MVKAIKRELFTTVRPDAVQPLRAGDTVLDKTGVCAIFGFGGIRVPRFRDCLGYARRRVAGGGITVIAMMNGAASCVVT